ncbi:MAG: hypothetical protein ACLGIZ_01570 [Acidimicrobiia bacterium]|jgi:hypothetical protein
MSDDKLQELIRSSTPRPDTPVDAESLWRRGQRRNRRRRAGDTGALASVLVVSVVATAAALGGGSDERVRTGETASSGSVESPTSQQQEPFEWGSHEHLQALADCVRAKGFEPILDLEDGRIEVHVPPKDDPVPVCEQELEDQGVVESRGPSLGEPGVLDAEARRQAATRAGGIPYDALFGRPASPHPGEPGLEIRSEGEPGKDGQDAFEMAEQTCSHDISG